MKKAVFFLFVLLSFKLLFSFEDIDKLIELKNYYEAELVLKRDLRDNPENVDFYLKLALVQLWQKKYSQALNNFEYVLNEAPSYKEAVHGKINCFFWQKKYYRLINFAETQELDLFIAEKLCISYFKIGNNSKTRFYSKKAKKLGSKKNLPYPKLLEIEYQYQYSDNDYIQDWMFEFQKIQYFYNSKLNFGFSRKRHKRFRKSAQQFAGYLTYHYSKKLIGEYEFHISTNYNYLSQRKFVSIHYINLFEKYKFLPYFGWDYSKYSKKENFLNRVGFEYYLPYNLRTGYKFTYIFDSKSEATVLHEFLLENTYKRFKNKLTYTLGEEIVEAYNTDRIFSRTITLSTETRIHKNWFYLMDLGYFEDENENKRYNTLFGLKYEY